MSPWASPASWTIMALASAHWLLEPDGPGESVGTASFAPFRAPGARYTAVASSGNLRTRTSDIRWRRLRCWHHHRQARLAERRASCLGCGSGTWQQRCFVRQIGSVDQRRRSGHWVTGPELGGEGGGGATEAINDAKVRQLRELEQHSQLGSDQTE
jgi:hypothetical protein